MIVKGYLKILSEKQEDQETIICKMQKSLNMMEDLIIGAKDTHRLKSLKARITQVSVDECFKEVAFIFEQNLDKKNVTIKFKNQLPSNAFALADQISLTHSVLCNLVSNAFKFSPPNSEILVSSEHKDESIILEVKDEGPGIPQKVIDSIMQNKESITSTGTMGEKGSGLGLSIVKSYVDSYGGRIEFITNSRGSNVRITLKRA